jgi:hypothetical protein
MERPPPAGLKFYNASRVLTSSERPSSGVEHEDPDCLQALPADPRNGQQLDWNHLVEEDGIE